MANVFEKNKQEIENLIKEAYDNASKAPKTGDIFKDNRAAYEETTMQEILKSYNGKYGVDIQAELRKHLEPTTLDKVRASIDGRDIDLGKKKEQEEFNKDISDAKKEGAQIDSGTEKKIEQKIEEKQKTNSNIDIKSEVLKASYETTLEEYHKLRQQLQEGQNGKMQTGNLVVNEKKEVELVLYEKYLKNLDMHYKSKNGRYISKDDKEIQGEESKLAYTSTKNDNIVKGKTQDNILVIKDLYDQRESIAEEISALSGKVKIMDESKFKEQMDELQEKYIKKTVEISEINPNPAELYRQIESKDEIESFNDRTVGYEYNRGLEDKSQNKTGETLNKEIDDTMTKSTQDSIAITNKTIDELVEAYEEAEDIGNYSKAEEILQSIEAIAGIDEAEVDYTKNQEQPEDSTKSEIEKQNKEQSSNLFDSRLSAVKNDDEISEIDVGKKDREKRLNSAIKKTGYTKSEQEKQGPELSRGKRY